MFNSLASLTKNEKTTRLGMVQKRLSFGITFLDDALRGIRPDDLVLLGASSGMGKTQLVTIIANANLEKGKRVHLLALESSKYEIVQRIKYQLTVAAYFDDKTVYNRIDNLNFADWMDGKFADQLEIYETCVDEYIEKKYKDFFIYTKGERFGIDEMIHSISNCHNETDLIIIDHAHYFDYDDDNENKALKEIAKTVRALSLDYSRPIVLVAHLRKRDRFNDDLAPGMEEFHGSSDLYKIATKVITISPGELTLSGKYQTFFRIPKNRIDGTVTRYLGAVSYDAKRGRYENDYQISWSHSKKPKEGKDEYGKPKTLGGFVELTAEYYPRWATYSSRRISDGNNSIPNVAPTKAFNQNQRGQGSTGPMSTVDKRY